MAANANLIISPVGHPQPTPPVSNGNDLKLVYIGSNGHKVIVDLDKLDPAHMQQLRRAYTDLATEAGIPEDKFSVDLMNSIVCKDGQAEKRFSSNHPKMQTLLSVARMTVIECRFNKYMEGERTHSEAEAGFPKKEKSHALTHLPHGEEDLLRRVLKGTKIKTEDANEKMRKEHSYFGAGFLFEQVEQLLNQEKASIEQQMKGAPTNIVNQLQPRLKIIKEAIKEWKDPLKMDRFATQFMGLYSNLNETEIDKVADELISSIRPDHEYIWHHKDTDYTDKKAEERYRKDLRVALIRDGVAYHEACKRLDIPETRMGNEHRIADGAKEIVKMVGDENHDTADLLQALKKLPVFAGCFSDEAALSSNIEKIIGRAKEFAKLRNGASPSVESEQRIELTRISPSNPASTTTIHSSGSAKRVLPPHSAPLEIPSPPSPVLSGSSPFASPRSLSRSLPASPRTPSSASTSSPEKIDNRLIEYANLLNRQSKNTLFAIKAMEMMKEVGINQFLSEKDSFMNLAKEQAESRSLYYGHDVASIHDVLTDLDEGLRLKFKMDSHADPAENKPKANVIEKIVTSLKQDSSLIRVAYIRTNQTTEHLKYKMAISLVAQGNQVIFIDPYNELMRNISIDKLEEELIAHIGESEVDEFAYEPIPKSAEESAHDEYIFGSILDI